MLPQADQLSETLRRHCALVGWQPRHLPAQGAATEPQLLEELIACREAGRADLSLELIQLADQADWQSPWLEDNRARALVHQQQLWRAAAIWRQLQAGADSGAAAAAAQRAPSGGHGGAVARVQPGEPGRPRRGFSQSASTPHP